MTASRNLETQTEKTQREKTQSGFAALLREPLLHFLVLGLLIFGLYEWWNRAGGEGENPDQVIDISADRIEELREMWLKRWRRPPSEKELRGVIETLAREEIYSREAIALGLDRNDPVLRRRLAEKLEFLTKDLVPSPEPGEEDLRGFFASEGDRYLRPARVSFSQIYFNPEKRGDRLTADLKEALSRLAREPELPARELGDPITLPLLVSLRSKKEIARRFGPEFAAAVMELRPGSWQGPVQSDRGVHLVRVTERIEAQMPALDDVREQVRRDLMTLRRDEVNRTFYEKLRERYRVVVDEKAFAEALRPAGKGTSP